MNHKVKVGDKIRLLTSGVYSKYKPGDVMTVALVHENGTSVSARKEPASILLYFYGTEYEVLPETPKFKVGDRVAKTSGFGGDGKAVGTVIGLLPSGSLQVALDAPHPLLSTPSQDGAECYTLLSSATETPPAETELERLVRVANEGYRAVKALLSGHRDAVTYGDEVFRCEGLEGNAVFARYYRIKPKPAFEPFYVGPVALLAPRELRGQWLVKLEGDTLHIGCKTFNAKNALDVLRLHCNGGCIADVQLLDGSHKPSGATRNGIELDGHAISWADADRILAALEKAGIK